MVTEDPDPVCSLAALKAKPDPSVVESLEEALNLAKSGELRGICITAALVYQGETVETQRYVKSGLTHMDAASMLEQHAHSLRAEVNDGTVDAPVERPLPRDL